MPNLKSKYYTHTSYGGVNECIIINKYFQGSVLANCVGYAWGRIYEVTGTKPAMGKGNANTLWNYNDGYVKTQTPSAGDIVTFTGGDYGHVAFVESVASNGDITISESDYYRSGSGYATKTLTKASGYNYGSGLVLQGFQQTEATNTEEAIMADWTKRKFLYHKEKRSPRTFKGNTYKHVGQVRVEKLNYYEKREHVGISSKAIGTLKKGDLIDMRGVADANGYNVNEFINDGSTRVLYVARGEA